MMLEMPCITCPMSCHLQVFIEDHEVIEVKGNTCPRGIAYAKKELSHPERMLTTTVQIQHALHPLLPVITSKPVPKEKIFDIIKACDKVCVSAPIQYNDVILSNILNLGVDICASRSMDEVVQNDAKDPSCNK